MSEIVYLNGSLVPASEAKISAFDYGFLYGFGLFETMRAYEGKMFKIEAHLKRLANGMKALNMPTVTVDLKQAVAETLKANNLSEARIRITVSAGEGSPTPNPASCTIPTVLITARTYNPPADAVYEKGFKAIVSSIRSNAETPLANVKTTQRLNNLLAKQEAEKKSADDAIFLNEHDLVAEATSSNIFLVSDEVLKTPRTENGILPGVTRDVVLDLASKLGVEAVEQDIYLGELLEAEEAFLTNSMMEIMPLTKVAKNLIGNGKPGTVTRKLRRAYNELVASYS